MRPKKYPYSGKKKESTAVIVDLVTLAKAILTKNKIPKDKVLSIDEVPRRYPEVDWKHLQ